MPPALAALQYVDVAQNGDLALSVAEIDAAIETDHEWVRAHTEWLARALRWQAGGRDDSALLRGSELDAAERWLAGRKNGKQPPPTDLQTSFILSGRRSERRRLRLLVGLSLAAVAVSLGLAVLALVARNDAIEQRDEANEQRNQALSRELASRATDELDSDPGRSLRLALRAAETARTGPAEAALQGALTRPHPRLALETRSPVAASAVTPDGRHAVTVHRDGLGRVWDLRNGRRLAVLRGHTAPITSVEISSDGRLAVTASALRSGERRDGTARIWELPSGRLLHELPHDAGGIETAVFDPAGRRVVDHPGLRRARPGGRLGRPQREAAVRDWRGPLRDLVARTATASPRSETTGWRSARPGPAPRRARSRSARTRSPRTSPSAPTGSASPWPGTASASWPTSPAVRSRACPGATISTTRSRRSASAPAAAAWSPRRRTTRRRYGAFVAGAPPPCAATRPTCARPA